MRKVLSAMLAAFIALPPASIAKPAKIKARDASQFQARLSKDQQVLHALDRLTFGPRLGDVAAVRRLGVKKWVEQQLHPERIAENPVLTRKLAPLASLKMSNTEIVENYPPPQLIRAIANGTQPLPQDPVLRATVERLTEKYKAKKNIEGSPTPTEPPARTLEQVLSRPEMRELRTATPEKRRDMMNAMTPARREEVLMAMAPGQRAGLMNGVDTATRRRIMLLNNPQTIVGFDLLEGKLYRAIYGNRQLQEVLTDFWFNHFNVYLDKGADRFLIPEYEREAIRPFVLGKFREMLGATAKSPAMLFYLDNWQSVAPETNPRVRRKNTRGLNENYARELMELHTLGVDGGYTQTDIVEVARCFTGWTIRNPQLGGDFFYNPRVHDNGEKTVLGVKIAAGGGMKDAEQVLDILVRHPSTAKFISKKLAMRFVADTPPQALIDRMAATFQKSDGDLRAVMKTMLESKEFWTAGAYRAKVKTPFEMIVSAVRALDGQVESASPLAQQIATLGQPLYRKIEPTGYSSANAEWVNSSALLARMNFALNLAQNKIPGVRIDTAKFSMDPLDVAKTVMFRDVSPETRAVLEKKLKDQDTKSPALVAGLVLGSPDFQRR